ncbi:MAG: flavin reductase family protein [Christensenellaceae bacterium]|jgi:flavin reductase (DIM6/NTAB) family NADH-FMN oxidoreductase RutF|nr:flavin reductase family protein [Christensenellaceae bacterium]
MDITALHKLTYGLYVVGVQNSDYCKFGGCIVDALAQISSEPNPLLIISCMKNNHTTENIKNYGLFTLSVLPENVNPFLVANFGFQTSRNVDKWSYVPHEIKNDLPVVLDAVAYLKCEVLEDKISQTHVSYICRTIEAWNGVNLSKPLIYANYLQTIRPLSAAAFKLFKETGKSPLLENT